MHKSIVLAALALGILMGYAPLSHAQMTYYLSQDLGTIGSMRYCRYSDGKVRTVDAYASCPMDVSESGYTNGLTGYLRSQYQDGMNTACVYDVAGNMRMVRLQGMQMCPMSQEF